eukprot:1966029-Rhodomonas_salina.1
MHTHAHTCVITASICGEKKKVWRKAHVRKLAVYLFGDGKNFVERGNLSGASTGISTAEYDSWVEGVKSALKSKPTCVPRPCALCAVLA